ncbi:MAG: hypothetical protein AB1798_24100 [Spirochaetota bacterium]
MDVQHKIKFTLEKINLFFKLGFLAAGAAFFFILFPFFLAKGFFVYILFFVVLIIIGALFRIVGGRKNFKVTIWLWISGLFIYLIIALILILKNIQPLPYMEMKGFTLSLYYLSYPFRVLGIFFTGLIFANITSPVEFLKFGGFGFKIALAYRAFEFSVSSFEENRQALIIQGQWPDFTKEQKNVTIIFGIIKSSPLLIATTFRNIILWFPWAWICYNTIKKDITRRRKEREATE